jgi:SAM-dependent methyltransferase
MTFSAGDNSNSRDPFGTRPLSVVDRFGVWLSQRAIGKHLPRGGKLDVLELGCGLHAKNLIGLLPRLRHGVGVDFAVSDDAKRIERLEFIEGPIDVATAGLEENSFDAILFISVLEHLWDPLSVLRDCRRWLRPDGVLFVNVPTWRGKVFLEFSAFRLGTSPKCEMDDHKMYYDKRDLWPLLVKAGFLPSSIRMHYHKFGLNLFAVVRNTPL